MSKSVLLEQALVLPAIDIAAMLRGQLIVAIPKVQIARGLSFLLCPEQLISQTEIVEQYRSPFLPLAEIAIRPNQAERLELEAWATCEQTQMIHDVDQLSTISSLTVWNRSYLETLLKERQYLFLSYLKVNRLSNWVTIPTEKFPPGKLGKFVGLSAIECESVPDSVDVSESLPILSDRLFAQRKEQIEKLKAPEHPELEELQSAIDHYSKDNPKAKEFNHELQVFLGWTDIQNQTSSSDNDWMRKIKAYGYRDDETDEDRKSNYQAGTDFEIIIRKSLEFLGFTVDESHAGGAGGIDIFCSQPYSLVGECKCGKGIPDSTVEQLDRIAKRHLKERYETASRFIIGPGNPSAQLLESAKLPPTSIMNPETLQKLVEFHDKYPINLLELRDKCLVAGQVEDKVDKFLAELTVRVSLRSYIVRSVKDLKNDDGDDFVTASTVRTHFNSKFASILRKLDDPKEAHTLLLELSSPLTGYLGREQDPGKDWKSDRFYFLRDLTV